MKYIRTKDGRIIKVDEIHQIDKTCEETYTSSSLGITFISPKDIVKQADYFEDLFDEYVLVPKDKTGEPKVVRRLCIYVTDYNVYGAMWVKGQHEVPILKPVAKQGAISPLGEVDWRLL